MKTLYFIIGTQAELMKLFKVINAARERGYVCKIISTGQNDLRSCPYLERAHAQVDMDITAKSAKKKDTSSYLGWFVGTARNGKKMLKEYFTPERRKDALCVVHGDTLTTTMGAWICKSLKLPYIHIESGLRSFNFLSPFPEEFDRLYGSTYSVMNFCPGKIHAEYAAKKFRGKAVDTVGAGDSMVAGFLSGWLTTGQWAEALRMGVAAGSASAFSPWIARREQVWALYDSVLI